MEQSPPAHSPMGVPTTTAAQIAYAAPYQHPPMLPPTSSFPTSSAHPTFQQAQQFHLQQQQQQQQQHQQLQQLQAFWAEQTLEIEQTTDFKNHSLPLARIKKIMKADEDVKMISAEAPVVFAKACEIFILELTLRSWINTEENKRRTLHKNDIAAAISRTDIFDFLVDIVPRDELKEEGIGMPRAGLPMVGGPPDTAPCYYQGAAPGMFMGKNGDIYAANQPHPGVYMPWEVLQGQSTQQHAAHQQQDV